MNGEFEEFGDNNKRKNRREWEKSNKNRFKGEKSGRKSDFNKGSRNDWKRSLPW